MSSTKAVQAAQPTDAVLRSGSELAQEPLLATNAVVFDPRTATMPADTQIIEKGVAGDFSVALNYHEFQQDEPVRGIWMGITNYECVDKQTGELKTIPGAVFITGRTVRGQLVKETRINCSVKFVDALKRMPQGFAFEATMTGRKQKGEKSIAQFHIVQLTAK
jgi:hypothetical protein